MDEKLKQILKIRSLQANCMAYRNSIIDYRKIVKQACISELKNLVEVEVRIEKVNLKKPDEHKIPNVIEEVKTSKADVLLKEISVVEEGLQLL